MRTSHVLPIGIVTILCGAAVLRAAAPMGTPGAMLDQGQWLLGAEYAQGEMDWDGSGRCVETVIGVGSQSYRGSFEVKDLETHAIFGHLAYGLTGDWDIFVRLGAGQAEADIEVPGADGGNVGNTRMDSDYGFAAGLGTRATFCRWDALSLGGLLQATWFDPGNSRFTYHYPGTTEVLVTDAELQYFQAHLSIAALYEQENWHVWIGPFLQYAQGDLDVEARYSLDGVLAGRVTCDGDLDDETRLGLHLGGGLWFDPVTLWLEGQFTADSWLWSVGAAVAVE